MSDKVKIALLLDNGDTIRGNVGGSKRSAQMVRIRQQIEEGELSAEEQKQRLDGISRIYQRLRHPAQSAQPSLAPVNGVADVATAPNLPQKVAKVPDSHVHAVTAPAKQAKPAKAPPAPTPKAAPAPAVQQPPAARARPQQTAPAAVARAAGSRMDRSTKDELRSMLDVIVREDKKVWFQRPVPIKIAPDYNQIIKQPMCCKNVRTKLEKGDYSTPAQMNEDMELIFRNCLVYNGSASVVGQEGARLHKLWQREWQGSPFASATGDVAAAPIKRPHSPSALDAAAPHKAHRDISMAHAQAGNHAHPAPRAPQKQQPGHARPYPNERLTALFDYIGSDTCGEQGQEQVVQFLKSIDAPLEEVDGDVEIDPDILDAPVLWRLDAFVQKQSGGRYAPDGPARGPKVQRMSLDDDSDAE